MTQKNNKANYILSELIYHLPFSIFGVSLGIILLGVLTFISIVGQNENMLNAAAHELFHVFHPLHILFSATATTAMFWKHEKNLIKAILIGAVGSLVICGVSDILFPFCGGLLLGAKMHIHICVVQNPIMILTFLFIGVAVGLLVPEAIEHSTEYSHAGHVFASSTASILYLIAFGITEWIHIIGHVFAITIIAVMIPCCLSDIVFPLVCTHRGCGCHHEKPQKTQ